MDAAPTVITIFKPTNFLTAKYFRATLLHVRSKSFIYGAADDLWKRNPPLI